MFQPVHRKVRTGTSTRSILEFVSALKLLLRKTFEETLVKCWSYWVGIHPFCLGNSIEKCVLSLILLHFSQDFTLWTLHVLGHQYRIILNPKYIHISHIYTWKPSITRLARMNVSISLHISNLTIYVTDKKATTYR